MGKSDKPTTQSIVGENLIATIGEINYYTRTLANMFDPKMRHKTKFRLILEYDYSEPDLIKDKESFTMDLYEDSLKGLADFIYNYLEKNNETN